MAFDTKQLLKQGLELLSTLLKTKGVEKVANTVAKEVSKPVAPVEVTIEPAKPAEQPAIDWKNPKSRISPNFTVSEALTLPSWGVMHEPSEAEKEAIKNIGEKVSKIVAAVAKKLGKDLHVSVHAWMRPGAAHIPGSQWDGKDYNRYIYETQVWKGLSPEEMAKKTVPNSPHKTGHAIDFHIVGYEGKAKCSEMRALMLPLLQEFGLRMENMEGGWIHLDDLPVVTNRFFKP